MAVLRTKLLAAGNMPAETPPLPFDLGAPEYPVQSNILVYTVPAGYRAVVRSFGCAVETFQVDPPMDYSAGWLVGADATGTIGWYIARLRWNLEPFRFWNGQAVLDEGMQLWVGQWGQVHFWFSYQVSGALMPVLGT